MRLSIKPISKSLLVAASLVLINACSLAPEYRRPDAPVAPTWPQAATTTATDSPATELGWDAFLGDARLQRLVALALENNRDLRVAVLNVEAARAQYRIQRADQLPGVNVQGDGLRQRLPDELTFPGAPAQQSQYTVGLGITGFELDLFGRVRSLKDAALAQYLATEEASRSARLSLVAAVADAYLRERAAAEQLDLLHKTLATWENSYGLTELRFKQGESSELDLRQSESLVKTARSELARFTRMRAQEQNALVLLIGQPLPQDLPAPRSLREQDLVTDVAPGLPSDLMTQRPDIRAAEQQLIAANAQIGAARAAFFPRIALTGAYGSASTELSGLFDGGSGYWSFTPRITLPIFQGGRNRAGLDLAKTRSHIAVAQYERAIQTAFREVADGLAARATFDEQIGLQESLVQTSARRLELSDMRYRSGVDSYLDMLDAQRSLYAAEQSLLETRYYRLSNLIGLYKALGGGGERQQDIRTAATTAD